MRLSIGLLAAALVAALMAVPAAAGELLPGAASGLLEDAGVCDMLPCLCACSLPGLAMACSWLRVPACLLTVSVPAALPTPGGRRLRGGEEFLTKSILPVRRYACSCRAVQRHPAKEASATAAAGQPRWLATIRAFAPLPAAVPPDPTGMPAHLSSLTGKRAAGHSCLASVGYSKRAGPAAVRAGAGRGAHRQAGAPLPALVGQCLFACCASCMHDNRCRPTSRAPAWRTPPRGQAMHGTSLLPPDAQARSSGCRLA